MNLNVLRYVEAIAEEQSFSKAAARLYVAQPSLSQAIQQLERDLGVTLFNRGARAVTLTPPGERYLRWATMVLHSEKKMRSDITTQGGLRKLTVGSSPYRCRTLLPPILREFCRMAPGCQVAVK
ncbi:MAG: LysR family transcriptional regulator, partial [Bacillota bacterium]